MIVRLAIIGARDEIVPAAEHYKKLVENSGARDIKIIEPYKISGKTSKIYVIFKHDAKDLAAAKKIKATPKFVKPTVEEIREYCNARQNTVNPQKFYDHYESKGWLVGHTKMRDWQASVRTWENSQDYAPRNSTKCSSMHFANEKNYTQNELDNIFGDLSDIKLLENLKF